MYPSDVLFPLSGGKYFGFVDQKYPYNSHWDITWSFTYALSGSNSAICTFLTTTPSISSYIPGHYLGYMGDSTLLADEAGNLILSEDGTAISVDLSGGSYPLNGILAICLDTTGYFALSNETNTGLSQPNIAKNSLIVRSYDRLLHSIPLTSLDSSFNLTFDTEKTYKTIRFRVYNGLKKLSISYKTDTDYKLLTCLDISVTNPSDNIKLYPSFTYCSPISGDSPSNDKLFLRNFHIQGNTLPSTTETITPPVLDPLTFSGITVYPMVSGIKY
jgi:hypothetical protein